MDKIFPETKEKKIGPHIARIYADEVRKSVKRDSIGMESLFTPPGHCEERQGSPARLDERNAACAESLSHLPRDDPDEK